MIKTKQLALINNVVKSFHEGETTGHDWFHIQRVVKMAKKIALAENADVVKVEIIALLHDVADYKLNNGDEKVGLEKISNLLKSINFDEHEIMEIMEDIKNISFKGGNNCAINQSFESKIVQDADRIDALGAIGIARAFAYGGSKHRELYNPAIKPQLIQTVQEYQNSKAPTLNHFYEKLLLLKDKMNTTTAKQIATQRHDFLEDFLKQFYQEWNDG